MAAAPTAFQAELTETEEKLSECMLGNWKLCTAGVMLGIPIGIKTKNYVPFVTLGVLGTAADFYQAYTTDCVDLRLKVDAMKASADNQ